MAGAAAGLAVAGPVNLASHRQSSEHADGNRRPVCLRGGVRISVDQLDHVVDQGGRARAVGEGRAGGSTDSGFRHVVFRRSPVARADRDFTVHQPVGGLLLLPSITTGFTPSTPTLESGASARCRRRTPIRSCASAFTPCSSYEAGYYTALGALAREPDLDLVLCLGDYIYEHHYYDGPAARRDHTGRNHDGDVQSLAEYRQKYRFYQSDHNLQTCTPLTHLCRCGTTTR